MNIFHILPKLLIPSGGIKCHYQLVELERELGYPAFIVYKDVQQVPTWFHYDVPHITEDGMYKIADRKRDVIVGSENIEPLLQSGFYNKVSYIQGEVFINRSNPYRGITVWFSNDFNKLALPHLSQHDQFIVTPFIDTTVFNYSSDVDWNNRKHVFSIQERKAGREAFMKILEELESSGNKFRDEIIDVNVIEDCSEKEFAAQLRDTKIFIAHSFPEGLGLPALEAMASGCLVVGFTGGGGTVYMEHGSNCLIASKDGDYITLTKMLEITYDMIHVTKELNEFRQAGIATSERFSKAATRSQLQEALSFFSKRD